MTESGTATVSATDLAVLGLVATLPFGGYVDLGVGGNLGFPVLNVGFLVAAAALLAARALRRGRVTLSRTHVVLMAVYALFVVWQWVAALAGSGGDLTGAFSYYHARTVGYLLLIGVVVSYVDSRSALRRVLGVGFAAALLAAALTVVDGVFRIGIGMRLLGSREFLGVVVPAARTVGVPLTFGAFGIYLLGVAPTFGLVGLRRRRPAMLAGVGLLLAGVVVAQTRSTWVAAGAAFGVLSLVAFVRRLRWNPRARPWLVGLGVVGVVAAALSVPLVVEALVAVNAKTASARVTQYRGALAAIVDAPLVGVGARLPAYVRTVGIINSSNSVHNAVLNVAATSGLPAVVLYVLAPLSVAVSAFRRAVGRRTDWLLAAGLCASTVAIIVDAQFLTSVGKVGWVWVAVAAGHEYWDAPGDL
jgi:hypothetical protein